MTREEAKMVKKQIDCYQSYMSLADEKDQKSTKLNELYKTIAGVHAVYTGPKIGSCGHRKDLSSKTLEVLSDQMETEQEAQRYRNKAKAIEDFIAAIPDAQYLTELVINGRTLEQVADDLGYSISNIRHKIFRDLTGIEADRAKKAGLL